MRHADQHLAGRWRTTAVDERHEMTQCIGTKADGTPCGAPASLVDDQTKLCRSHDPAKRDAIKAAARRGGQATARRNRSTGLEEHELPPLNSPEVAEIWLERIARAVSTGRMPHQDARAATSALEQGLKAHEVGKMADRLEALRAQLEQVKSA